MPRPLIVMLFAVAALSAYSQSVPATRISLPEPAYVGMPMWMQVESATNQVVRYPSSTTPNDFYCNDVEVKRDGQLIPPLKGFPPGGRTGPACGSLAIEGIAEGRLPIHLQYPLHEPGDYLVRFTRHDYRGGIAEQSAWTPLHVRSAKPETIQSWLVSELESSTAPPAKLLEDVFPSLLASRDDRVLRLMIQNTYRTCTGKEWWWCPEFAVASYAAESLRLFNNEARKRELLRVIGKHGPSDAIAYALNPSDDSSIARQIVAATLPRLTVGSSAQVAAALHTLQILRDPHFGLPADTLARISNQIQASVDFVVAQKNQQAAQWISQSLSTMGSGKALQSLWKLVDARLATEQALICITWLRDPADLPRLAAIVKQKDPSDPPGYDSHAAVVSAMRTGYGERARPYLREILASSRETWVLTSAAQALVELDDQAGWQFFLDVVHQRPFYHDEMMRWLWDRFPSIRGANDDAVKAFLESKLYSVR